MNSLRAAIVSIALSLIAPIAHATFHTFELDQLYSNADGSVQFVVLHEVAGLGSQNFLVSHSLTSTRAGATNSFPFPNNLPSTATAGKRFLVATQAFAALGLVTPDYVVPNGFLATGAGTLDYAGVDQVSYSSLPVDGVHAINRSGAQVQNVATNFAGASASVTGGAPPAPSVDNYQGIWWNAPAGSESGWGINFAHQGDVIFATWFTYDAAGKAWWLSMTANKTAAGVYSGDLFQTRGPAFNAVPFDPATVIATKVGTGTLTFSDASNGTFAYTVNGISQTKSITPMIFATPMPTCTFDAQASLASASNYQDLWWNSPAQSESGWGINFAHQGDIIFGTWFTYATDGTAAWFTLIASKTAPGTYAGQLYNSRGPAFNAVPFSPGVVVTTPVGNATLTFANGNAATFAYTLNGVSQTKTITRLIFRAPGTVCQ